LATLLEALVWNAVTKESKLEEENTQDMSSRRVGKYGVFSIEDGFLKSCYQKSPEFDSFTRFNGYDALTGERDREDRKKKRINKSQRP
jgi:hypothetical protein